MGSHTMPHIPTFILPAIRFIRDKNFTRQWEVIWIIDGRTMTAPVHPTDRAYLEAAFDIVVDTMVTGETYEYLILKEKPAPAPEKEIEK